MSPYHQDKFAVLIAPFLLFHGTASAGPPAHYWDQPQFNPVPLMDDGTWIIPDYNSLVESWGMTLISQTPGAGSIHQGVPGPQISLTCEGESGIVTETFTQHLADRTPPLVEVVLETNKPWSISPGNAAMYVATEDDPLVFEPITVLALDTVDENLDISATLNGEEIMLYGGAGLWFTDPFAVDHPLNWLTIAVVDDFGNESAFSYYFEVRDEPFYSGDLTVLGLSYEELGGEFHVTGTLEVSADGFSVLDVHPGSVGLYFEKEDGSSLDSISGECCSDGTEIVVTPEDGTYSGGESLIVEFAATFSELPHSLEMMGRSTWEDNEFLFLAKAPAVYGLAFSGGGSPGMAMAQSGDPWKLSPYAPEEPEYESNDEVECEVEPYIDAPESRLDPGSVVEPCGNYYYYYTRERIEIVLVGATIRTAGAWAYDNCLNADAQIQGVREGTTKVIVRPVPPRCAVGEVTLVSAPSFTASCRQSDGMSFAAASIIVNSPTTTSDPSVAKPRAAGGVRCIPQPNDAGNFEIKFGNVGIGIPVMLTGPRFEAEHFDAYPPLNHTYECSPGITISIKGSVSVGAYANRGLFYIGPSTSRAQITEAKLNTQIMWDLVECKSDPPKRHTDSVELH
jgi:hypothetical protein